MIVGYSNDGKTPPRRTSVRELRGKKYKVMLEEYKPHRGQGWIWSCVKALTFTSETEADAVAHRFLNNETTT